MKKTMKRFASLMLAMALAVSMAIGAFAAPAKGDSDYSDYTITIAKGNAEQKADTDGVAAKHTYEAYQIFKGTLSEDNKMGQIDWGTGVDLVKTVGGKTLVEAIFSDSNFTLPTGKTTETVTAADIADLMDEKEHDADIAKAFANIVSKYLTTTKKTSTVADDPDDGYVITDVTTGYYFIKDRDNSQGSKDEAYTRFVLKVVGDTNVEPKDNVPSVDKEIVQDDGTEVKYGDYNVGDTVTFKLTATLPSNFADYTKRYKLSFVDTLSDGLTIVKNGTNVKDLKIVYGDDMDVTAKFTQTINGQTITLSNDDLLNDGVTYAANGKFVVTYSAVLNANAEKGNLGNDNTVKLIFSNNPNDDGNGEPDTGETPEDKVVVFTFDLITNKVDGDDASADMDGTQFKLYKLDGSDKKYYKFTAATETDPEKVEWVAEADGDTLTVSDGKFTVHGLDTGTYYLQETYAKPGYNKISDVSVMIIATYKENTTAGENPYKVETLDLTTDGTKGNVSVDDGTLEQTIENNKGPVLPSTGGIGTTIFYVVGGVLVIGAAVLLVTKRRMDAEK